MSGWLKGMTALNAELKSVNGNLTVDVAFVQMGKGRPLSSIDLLVQTGSNLGGRQVFKWPGTNFSNHLMIMLL